MNLQIHHHSTTSLESRRIFEQKLVIPSSIDLRYGKTSLSMCEGVTISTRCVRPSTKRNTTDCGCAQLNVGEQSQTRLEQETHNKTSGWEASAKAQQANQMREEHQISRTLGQEHEGHGARGQQGRREAADSTHPNKTSRDPVRITQ